VAEPNPITFDSSTLHGEREATEKLEMVEAKLKLEYSSPKCSERICDRLVLSR